MSKITRELTVKEVERLREEGAYAVGGVPGLYLQIVGGSRSWYIGSSASAVAGAAWASVLFR